MGPCDGFISYSHAADGLLAPRLQAGLQQFAKPWWRRRAVRIFRDESSLTASPGLWTSVTEALDASEWFILLLSPEAARSSWVADEISYWTMHKDRSRVLPVVTHGEFEWRDGSLVGDAVPEVLRGVFAEEPRWVDLRFARTPEQLDLKDPRFASAVADLASAIRDVPRDDLASEEIRQHRRVVRTAWTGVAALVALLGVAVGMALYARSQRDAEAAQRAVAERERAIARAGELSLLSLHELETDPERALLLAIAAVAEVEELEDDVVLGPSTVERNPRWNRPERRGPGIGRVWFETSSATRARFDGVRRRSMSIPSGR